MNTVQNPRVPFTQHIPGGMTVGKMVTIKGKIPSMSQRFAVNLLNSVGDVALHINPRFTENRVVRNSSHNMNWGPEESRGSMPVFAGQSFELLILCEAYVFKIAFNGRHFAEFTHRLPYNSVKSIAVDGEVEVHSLSFKEPVGGLGNSNSSGPLPMGFQPSAPPAPPTSVPKSGGLYPSVDPLFDDHTPGFHPNPTPQAPSYPTQPTPAYPSQPAYPHSYPTLPKSDDHDPSRSSFLDQAGMALAGVLGPSLIAGSMKNRSGGTNLLDHAGHALAGVLGGAGLPAAAKSHGQKETDGRTSSTIDLNTGLSALAGVLGGAALSGLSRNQPHHRTGSSSENHNNNNTGFLGQATSVLADYLASANRTHTGVRPNTSTTNYEGGILGQAGSLLADYLGGAASGRQHRVTHSDLHSTRSNNNNPAQLTRSGSADGSGSDGLSGLGKADRGMGPGSSSYRRTTGLDQDKINALEGFLEETGLSDNNHYNHKKMGGVLGGTLGTAIAGAALTGHLNPKKALKKQLKAQKKALKYGLPIAGVGIGAYAIHKGLRKLGRSSSSSSCSSSD